MKQFLVSLLCVTLAVYTNAQNADSTWFVNNYVKKEYKIPMRDGSKLFTSVYMPKSTDEQHPILLSRTPYSCAPYGENNYRTYWASHYLKYAKLGYILVTQDVRGRWMSEGTFVDVRPHNPNKKGTEFDEASDTYDAIEWMVKNIPNNNGNVGVFGISYPGFYSTMAALSNHPSLKAVSPQAPVTDWFMGDDFHHNGAFMLMDGFTFYSSFGKPRPQPTTEGPKGFPFPTNDMYSFFLRTGALTNFSKLFGDSIQFWKDLMNHPNYDAWWQARNPRNFTTNVKPATLVVGGTFDAEDCFGAWETYKAIENKSKNTDNRIVMGPWYHGQWAGRNGETGDKLGNVRFGQPTSTWYAENVEIPFFEYHLRGKGSVKNIAEATVFFTGENNWKTFTQWPPSNVKPTAYSLRRGGGLSTMVPMIAPYATWDSYVSDPQKPVPYTALPYGRRTREYMTDDQRFAASRPDVLTYTTPALTEEITLAGEVVANLFVKLSTTDADFVVKVIDVFPDSFSYAGNKTYEMNNYQMLVRGEVMRGKFRNSFEKPEPFVPNKPTQVKFTLPDVAHTFQKGHKIMIQIQSSWFPLVDRNPQQFMDIYKATDKDFIKSTIGVFHNQSKIILPIMK
ncbi:MAG: CocE/NonD family hydrolase [Bacteroidetes bacterium]|nr:MAG: CocE/NonD family hydrolase [Bacteroidota bacterium]TAE62681.1 MAG: CocE/NonD family hydrolase [Bacteroidota bacterium]